MRKESEDIKKQQIKCLRINKYIYIYIYIHTHTHTHIYIVLDINLSLDEIISRLCTEEKKNQGTENIAVLKT